jgi:RNA polymerase-binding transcription factor
MSPVSEPSPHLDPASTEELRGRLLAARDALLRTVAATDEELAALEAPGPGDSPDHASAVPAALLASRVAGQDKRELDEIAAALRRMGSGAYGVCEACHEPIALARLRAVPAARYCRPCQAAKE